MTDVSPVSQSTRLELTWPNKDKFLLAPEGQDGKPVWVERDHPAAHEVRLTEFTCEVGDVNAKAPYADNLLLTGDSLDVLRILSEVPEYRRHYRGKVKLIYIDPPFNTGQTFEHYDDWMEHSTWLSFMRDRLILMRELLAPDGSIWVQLDEVEQHRMRCLLDEVMGAANFVADLAVETNPKGRQMDPFFAGSHNSVTVYAKDVRKCGIRAASRDLVNLKDYPERLPDGTPFRYLNLRNTNRKFTPDNPATRTLGHNLYVDGDSGAVFADPHPGLIEVKPQFGDGAPAVWRWSAAKVRAERDQLVARRVNGRWGERIDVFQVDVLSDTKEKKYKTMWASSDIGSSDESKSELKALGLAGFDTPKPEKLLRRVVEIATRPGDIVLDCFGGSGTTAAVAHKMGRRWVTAEILPKTVEAFTRPRLEKVVAGEDPGGITEPVGWAGGGGFRCVEVGPSMYEVDEGLVLLVPWATNGKFAKAVAGQLGFEWQSKKHAPFCGVRGRMRLAVLDGAVGPEEVREITSALGEGERVTIVAKVVLPETEEVLRDVSRGSRVRKAPRDLLVDSARKGRRGGAR